MYGLCDCNNFFASCERVFKPSLNGKPVVVLSSNDGCIIARSNEAKALGLKMGQPFFQAQEIIQSHQVAVFSGNMPLYGDMSRRVMQTLQTFAPSVEVYSIDEAFLDFFGFPLEGLQQHGQEIARVVRRNTGIPVSIGIAPTKTLAKVASKLCKKYPKLKGACLMYRPEDISKVLATYPLEDIWGIGRRYSKMLRAEGIETAEQFRRLPPDWVQKKMSVVGLRTWKELHGQACIALEHSLADKQSITVSRSFAHEYRELAPLSEALSTFVASAAAKLRAQQSLTAQMQIYILTNRHREGMPQHYESALLQFPVPTDSTLEMVKAAMQALRKLFRQGYAYKKAGVTLQEISKNSGVQSMMFDEIDRPKHKALMQTIDALNATHGKSSVSVASQGRQGVYALQEHLSPHYTTDWKDILKVKL